MIIYQLLCEGRAHCEVGGGAPVEVSPGDLVAVPHGDHHLVGSGRVAAPVDVSNLNGRPLYAKRQAESRSRA